MIRKKQTTDKKKKKAAMITAILWLAGSPFARPFKESSRLFSHQQCESSTSSTPCQHLVIGTLTFNHSSRAVIGFVVLGKLY